MNIVESALLGFAVGDALGLPVQFVPRARILKPITKMLARESINMPAGSWSDDTSLIIATMSAFLTPLYIDTFDIMENFTKWIKEGDFTPTGKAFDVGQTTLKAINNFMFKKSEPTQCGLISQNSCGNGSLMRILPIAFIALSQKLDEEGVLRLTNKLSSLTHRHEICILGCYI